MICVRNVTAHDIKIIARSLRPAESRELASMGSGTAANIIHDSIVRSSVCGVFDYNDEILCVFGLSQPLLLTPRSAQPWLLGTKALDRHPKSFMRETRRWVDLWAMDYDVLHNWVDARYTKALRWLKWLGFDIFPACPVGNHGALFHFVERRRPLASLPQHSHHTGAPVSWVP